MRLSQEDASVIAGMLLMIEVGHPFSDEIKIEAGKIARLLVAFSSPPRYESSCGHCGGPLVNSQLLHNRADCPGYEKRKDNK